MTLDQREKPERFGRLFRDDPEHPNPLLSPPALFSILLIMGGSAVVFGFLNLGNSLKSPFHKNAAIPVAGSGADNLVALKTKDTDGDGLTDYDELYVYGTSPYLKDSDSDGFSDSEEINSNNDPNCPLGKVCSSMIGNSNTALTNQTNAPINGLVENTNASYSDLLGITDVASLREVLKKSGAPASVINATDDATLLELYKQVINEANAGAGATNTTANSDQTTADQLKNLSPQEIRDLLVSNGADAAAVQQLSDSELQAIFLQALAQETANTNSAALTANTNGS